jgi:hypothetical protein
MVFPTPGAALRAAKPIPGNPLPSPDLIDF